MSVNPDSIILVITKHGDATNGGSKHENDYERISLVRLTIPKPDILSTDTANYRVNYISGYLDACNDKSIYKGCDIDILSPTDGIFESLDCLFGTQTNKKRRFNDSNR